MWTGTPDGPFPGNFHEDRARLILVLTIAIVIQKRYVLCAEIWMRAAKHSKRRVDHPVTQMQIPQQISGFGK